MADDERRHALLSRELREQAVDDGGASLVELAGRLVGDQQPRSTREGSAERDALLLTAGQLGRPSGGAIAQPHPLEERMGPSEAIAVGDASQPERYRDQLLGGQLTRERAPVVLVGVAERVGAILREAALRERPEVGACDRDAAGTRTLEAGDHPHQRRLARTARADHDAHLALVDVERQPLQGGDTALGSGIDAEQVTGLDEAHAPLSCARTGPRSLRNAPRVARATSNAATSR